MSKCTNKICESVEKIELLLKAVNFRITRLASIRKYGDRII